MFNLIQAAQNHAALAGGIKSSGGLVSHAPACVEPPFSSRPKIEGKKGGLNRHGLRLHAALIDTPSYRRTALQGGYCLDVKEMHTCETKKSAPNDRSFGEVSAKCMFKPLQIAASKCNLSTLQICHFHQ